MEASGVPLTWNTAAGAVNQSAFGDARKMNPSISHCHCELGVRTEGHGLDTIVVTKSRDQLARINPPQPRRAVIASSQGGLAVRAEGHGVDNIVVTKSRDQLARIRAPQPRRAVIASGQDELAIRAEGDGLDPIVVTKSRDQL